MNHAPRKSHIVVLITHNAVFIPLNMYMANEGW